LVLDIMHFPPMRNFTVNERSETLNGYALYGFSHLVRLCKVSQHLSGDKI